MHYKIQFPFRFPHILNIYKNLFSIICILFFENDENIQMLCLHIFYLAHQLDYYIGRNFDHKQIFGYIDSISLIVFITLFRYFLSYHDHEQF